MEKFSVQRLIGAPPGYVGYEEGGQLTEAVRRRPYQVILLDEIEKAHPDVFNVLLQVLDDGRLTDGQGRTVDFKNSVRDHDQQRRQPGHRGLRGTAGTGDDGLRGDEAGGDSAMLRGTFRPEFLNRVDEVIVFHALTEADLARIVDLLLADLGRRLAGHDLALELTPAAKARDRPRGHGPDVRGAAAQADDPAAGREPAGAGAAARRVPARASDPRWTRTRSPARSSSRRRAHGRRRGRRATRRADGRRAGAGREPAGRRSSTCPRRHRRRRTATASS